MSPSVSILLPYKNAEPFFIECLESISVQTFTNWECLLINDHSSDNSEIIAKEFAQKDTRFKLFNAPKNGLIEANKFGIEIASGKYLTRMDADDIMAPNKLEVLFTILQNNGAGTVATSKVAFFPKELCGVGTVFYENWLNERCVLQDHAQNIWRECTIPSPNWMMLKTDLQAIGGFENYQYPEDYEMAFQCVLIKYKIIASTDILHHWRQHDNRHSKNSADYSAENFMLLKWKYYQINYNIINETTLLILGNGKKSKILQKLIAATKHTCKVWNPKNQTLFDFIEENGYNATTPIISTLSSIDNWDKEYQYLDSKGLNFVKFC